ncbi:MAG: flap endonuclease-1 [Thermoplasmatota archaeon]
MGIDLGELVVRRPAAITDFSGQRLACDAWNILYQFLASIRQRDGTPLTDLEGAPTSHLVGILTRTGALVEAGIRPVFVFDGPPHALKARTLSERAARKTRAALEEAEARAAGDEERARTKAMQTSRLTVPMVVEAQKLLRALGIPVVQAPGEGEAQASWMAQEGLCSACVSQDFDALLFGAPKLVRNLSVGGRRKLPGKEVWVEAGPEVIFLEESLALAKLTRAQLVDVALLVGNDFSPGVKGVGAKRAATLVAREGSLVALLKRLEREGATSGVERLILGERESLGDVEIVRQLFLEPGHAAVAASDLALRPPDAEEVRHLLVDLHGFSPERVASGLAKFSAAPRGAQKTLF